MQSGSLFYYLSWRGDLTFQQSPFNDVDNLVFCFLCYADLRNINITPEENEIGISVKTCYERLINVGGFPRDLDMLINVDEFRAIANTKRFGDVLIKDYVDITQTTNESIQFSCMNFCFGKNEHFIAFRGTDDSIAGWKEDLNLIYKKIPAQDMAVEYLEKHIQEGHIYYVGGHSKGGNLAIYGCAKANDEKYSLIKHIYMNDAPGICQEVMDVSFLKKIDQKTTKIIPTYSFIGMVFPYPFSNTKIVKSYEKGLVQHNIKSWLVKGTVLDESNAIDPEALYLDEAIAKYVSDTEFSEREKLINELFDAFDDKGKKKTVSSVRNGGIRELQRFLLNLASKTSSTKRSLTRLPFTVMFGKTLMALRHIKPIDLIVHNLAIPIGLFFLILGFVFLFIPFHYFPMVIGSIFVFITIVELITFFYMLFLSKWNLKTNMMRLYLVVILSALSASYFISPELMGSFSCILFGITMMACAFALLRKIIDLYYKDNIFSLLVAIIEMINMFAVGVYFIISNDYSSDSFAQILGSFFLVLGGLRIIEGLGETIRLALKRHERKNRP